MSKDESILSNVSGFGASGGSQGTNLVKVLASVVETQKNLASQFSALFDRVEEARNETRRNVTALTDEIRKLELRSNTIFEKITSQLMAQNETLTTDHANERSQWSAQNEAISANHAAERLQWAAQNDNMLSLIRATMGNVPRPTPPVLMQPMQAYNQGMTANEMFGRAPSQEQQLIDQFSQLNSNQIGAMQHQMHQLRQMQLHQQQQQAMLATRSAASSTTIAAPTQMPSVPAPPKVEVKPVAPAPTSIPTPAPAPSKPKAEEPKKSAPVVPAAPKVEVKPVAPTPTPTPTFTPIPTPAPSKVEVEEPKKSAPVVPAAANAAWGDKFKMTAGEWECTGCYVRNPADGAECSCCGSANPNCEKKESDKPANPFGKNVSIFNPTDASSSSGPKFSFGLGGGSTTAPATTTTPVEAPKTETKTTTPASGFSFAAPTATTTTTTTVAPSTAAPKFSFLQAAAAASKEDEKKPAFGSSAASSNAFGAGVTPTPTSAAAFSFKTGVTPAPTATASPFSFKTPDPSKPASIFGGSQKTLFGTSNPSTPVDVKKAEEEKNDTPSSVFGSSFMSGAQSTSSGLFSALTGKPSIFDQQDKVAEGQKNFASLAKSKPFGHTAAVANDEEGEEGEPEEYEPDVEFAPVVPLPDLVEVKTGEEEEKVLFSARSKIFRFVRETKEYKERGVGELKLLHNESTNKYRVVMRREQVHKLCANFSVLKNSKLMEKQGQSNVRSIVVTDFAENEAGGMESLCIKFKNAEVAKDFDNAFHQAQASLE